MEFKKLNAPSLKELFVNELQNMILSGKLERLAPNCHRNANWRNP